MARSATRSSVALLAGCLVGCSPPVTSPGPATSWPNEPAGFRVLTDWGFDQVPPGEGDSAIPNSPGWSVVYGITPGPTSGSVQLASDTGAPFSPPHVYDMIYPQG